MEKKSDLDLDRLPSSLGERIGSKETEEGGWVVKE